MDTDRENKNLSSILFTKTRRALLSLLYGHADESFYLRQIVRITGAGLGPVQRELKLLYRGWDSQSVCARAPGLFSG